MNKYKVIKRGKDWIVIDEKGYIANGKKHTSQKLAKTHCDNINGFAGYNRAAAKLYS